MNILTNLLYLLYFYYFFRFNIDDYSIYFLILGVFLPYSQELLLPFIKKILRYYNKITYSIVILSLINVFLSLILSIIYSYNFIHIFFAILLGNFLTISTSIMKNKDVYLFYPLTKKGFSLSLSNYFDPIPITIMMTSIFIFIFRSESLTFIEKVIPIILLSVYFTVKFLIKKHIHKRLNLDKRSTILPSYNFFVWRILISKKYGSIIYYYDLINKKVSSASYYKNNISKENCLFLERSKLYKEFKKYFKETYQKEYVKNGKTYLLIFDLRNFFSFFKREQIYLEIIIKDNNIYKEKIYI